MLESALLEVRVLPWRPRKRVMSPQDFREAIASDPLMGEDDLPGLVIGFAVWVLLLIAAPLVVLVLAVLLFSVELPLVLLLAVVLVVARFAGLIPWTVVILNSVTGEERLESYRNVMRARRRIREVNADRRVRVRWAWV